MAIDVTVSLSSPAFLGVPYSGQATATGGVAPYVYTISAGDLPDGLSIDAATGAVTGTPVTVEDSSFTITATDSTSATGTIDWEIDVLAGGISPVIPVPFRANIAWQSDDCLIGGRQTQRVFYDAVQFPNYSTILRGNLQQPIGLIKSLLFSINLVQINVNAGDLAGVTLVITSSLTGQKLRLGPTPDIGSISAAGNALCDINLNGCVPFFANEDAPVTIEYGGGGEQANVVLHFANWEMPAFFFATTDNWSD
jgi:hypothetical protein